MINHMSVKLHSIALVKHFVKSVRLVISFQQTTQTPITSESRQESEKKVTGALIECNSSRLIVR